MLTSGAHHRTARRITLDRRPEAADAEPELVARLRAVQDQRRRLRRTGGY